MQVCMQLMQQPYYNPEKYQLVKKDVLVRLRLLFHSPPHSPSPLSFFPLPPSLPPLPTHFSSFPGAYEPVNCNVFDK